MFNIRGASLDLAVDNSTVKIPYSSPSGHEALELFRHPKMHPLQGIDSDRPVDFASLEKDVGLLALVQYKLMLERFFPLNMDKNGNYIGDVNTFINYRLLTTYIRERLGVSENPS